MTALEALLDTLRQSSMTEYKQPANWTLPPNELDTAASKLDTWMGLISGLLSNPGSC